MKYATTMLCAGIILLAGSCRAASGSDATLKTYIAAASAWDAGDCSGALELANACVGAYSDFQPAVLLRGKALFLLGDDDAAIATLSKAVSLSPRAGQAALWLARAYRARGDLKEAQRVCDSALQADPSNIAMLRLASMLAIDGGDAGAARAFLDRALDGASEAGMAFVDRASMRWAGGDRLGASADIEAALVLLPTDSGAGGAARVVAERIRGLIEADAR